MKRSPAGRLVLLTALAAAFGSGTAPAHTFRVASSNGHTRQFQSRPLHLLGTHRPDSVHAGLRGLLRAGQAAGPTIEARPADPPNRNFYVIYYDDAFLFGARHYGDSRDFGGNTEPGLLVHSKEKSLWIQVTAISTAGGRFGKSMSDDPEARKKLIYAPVGWDFTGYARRPWIEQPLRTSGSIAFPERVEYDLATGRYALHYLSSWGVPSAETVLYIVRADLVAAFAAR